MLNAIKNIIIQLRNNQNRISFNSDISLDTRIEKNNTIIKSRIYNSILHNNSVIDNSSIFSTIVGNNTQVNHVTIFSGKISDHVVIGSNTTISASDINRYTYLAGNSRVFNSHIGAFCSIAENVSVGHAEHPYNHFSTSPVFYKRDNPFGTAKFLQQEIKEFKETIIGNDVWIGLNAYVKSGVRIGDGSIIGAGSIVTKDVPPYSIVAGVPAEVIKKRFDEKTILKLKEECWWSLPDEELIEYAAKNW